MKKAALKRAYVIAGSALVFSAIVGGLGFLSRSYIGQVSKDFIVANPSATSTLPDSAVKYELVGATRSEPQSFRQVLLSSPLVIFQRSLGVQFSSTDVFEETNRMRVETGIEPLSLNRDLVSAAEQKVADMFERQYFEHQTPEGNGPDLFVKNAGYEYVSIGENLALGDFGSERELVTAWMNSPGHRENILRSQFQEVGVAIGKGMYQGRYVTIAVQHFGRPLSSCPSINYAVRREIDGLRTKLTSIGIEIDKTNEEIQYMKKQNSSNSSELENKIRSYNGSVDEYNSIIEAIKKKTEEYNVSVSDFNDCLKRST